MKKFITIAFLLLCGNAFAQFRQGNITINVFRVDTTGAQVLVSDGDTLFLDVSNAFRALKINLNGVTIFSVDTTGTVYTATRYDAIGAVDLDIGSADVTDIQLFTDGTGDAEVVLPAQSISGTEILNATIDSTDVTNASIAATDLVNASVLNAKLAPSAVDSAKIKDATIINADIRVSTLDSSRVAPGGLTQSDIRVSSLDSSRVAPGGLTLSDLRVSSLDSSRIKPGGITLSDIRVSSLDSSVVAPNGLTAADLRPNSVGASEIIETDDYTFGTVALTVIDESSVSAGSNSFSGTATTDTVTVSGALITDIYRIELTGAGAPSANDFYRIEKTATGFVIHRSASGTSGLTYDWFRSKP